MYIHYMHYAYNILYNVHLYYLRYNLLTILLIGTIGDSTLQTEFDYFQHIFRYVGE